MGLVGWIRSILFLGSSANWFIYGSIMHYLDIVSVNLFHSTEKVKAREYRA